uniref:Uncharacterized protein n=1 Tax=Amphimedon queenslandica TaxID=400682 RepID=A0A1X7V790_AMPQE
MMLHILLTSSYLFVSHFHSLKTTLLTDQTEFLSFEYSFIGIDSFIVQITIPKANGESVREDRWSGNEKRG